MLLTPCFENVNIRYQHNSYFQVELDNFWWFCTFSLKGILICMLLRVVRKNSVFSIHRNFSVCYRHLHTSFFIQNKPNVNPIAHTQNNHSLVVRNIVHTNLIRGRYAQKYKQFETCKNSSDITEFHKIVAQNSTFSAKSIPLCDHHFKIYTELTFNSAMSTNNNNEAKLQEELKALQEQQTKQGEVVRELKKKGKDDPDFKKALVELEKIKAAVEAKQKELKPAKIEFPRERFNRLMAQRFFIAPSFEIYGGIAGLYDLGPPGTHIINSHNSNFL